MEKINEFFSTAIHFHFFHSFPSSNEIKWLYEQAKHVENVSFKVTTLQNWDVAKTNADYSRTKCQHVVHDPSITIKWLVFQSDQYLPIYKRLGKMVCFHSIEIIFPNAYISADIGPIGKPIFL